MRRRARPGRPPRTPAPTAQGVTKDKILLVHYIPDYGAEVNAVLRAQGLYYDAGNARIANAAYQGFMNKAYNLLRAQDRDQDVPGHLPDRPAGRRRA